MEKQQGVSSSRINTFMVNFSEAPKKPKVEVVTDLIFNKIKIPSERVKSFQFNGSRGITYVECDNLDYALGIVEKHDKKHEVEYENHKFFVPLIMDDGATVVRIHDLPPQLDNNFIKNEMGKFGEVLSIRSESWENPVELKGIPSGIRRLRIRLTTTIPSYIFMGGHSTLVTYKNQLITCRHCGRQVHYGSKCAEITQIINRDQKSVNMRLQRPASAYASVVQTTIQKPMKRPASEEWHQINMTNLNNLVNKTARQDTEATNTKRTMDTTQIEGTQTQRALAASLFKSTSASNINHDSDVMVRAEQSTVENTNTNVTNNSNMYNVLMEQQDHTIRELG